MLAGGSNITAFRAAKTWAASIWGSAAWVKTQLTPGVSTLAVPRPIMRPRICAGERIVPRGRICRAYKLKEA